LKFREKSAISPDTESSFNEKVQEIMNSVLSSSYAFVEHLEKTHMDEKIFTIDINKCRRNIWEIALFSRNFKTFSKNHSIF